MRPSAVVLLFGPCALVGACATGDPIDDIGPPAVATGGGFGQGGFDSGPGAETGGGVGNGGAGLGAGGIPVGASGGSVNMGGQSQGAGGAAPGGLGGQLPGTGGVIGSGGQPQGSGGTSSGGSSGGCRSGEKSCGGVCVSPAPTNGCGAQACTACTNTAPAHAVLACNAQGQCDFDCLSGFTRNGSTCQSGTGGGTGGATGGAGGVTGGGTGGATGGTGGAVTSCTSADGTQTLRCDNLPCPSNQVKCCQNIQLPKNLAPPCLCLFPNQCQ